MKYVDKVRQAEALIRQYRDEWSDRVAVACSFGKDSMVVLHMALSLDPRFPVFSVMTPFKPRDTLRYKDQMAERWMINLKTYCVPPDLQDAGYPGVAPLWSRDPDACCQKYKVEMTRQAIRELSLGAWITGLRRTEGRTRESYDYVEVRDGLVKVNPILDFTELDVWRYLATNNIPVNPLYGEGYRSLGCEPCSVRERDESEGERDGRWQGTGKWGGECGIHTQSLR